MRSPPEPAEGAPDPTLAELVGEERASEHLAATTLSMWIYRQVLEDPRVREVNTRHGLLVP